MVRFSDGKINASHDSKKQRNETKANCMTVRVAGFSKAFRIDFVEVFVRAEDPYQRMQRN
jgi:hypothetical protein